MKPAFEDGDGGAEVVAEGQEQVDVVGVLGAGEAVGEVGAGVDDALPIRSQRLARLGRL